MPLADRIDATELRLSEVISALFFALDLTEGQAPGHSVRSCIIGMRLARELRLPPDAQSALFYALLLKDAGCSSNAARLCNLFAADDRTLKREHKLIDWTAKLPAVGYALEHTARDRSLFERLRRIAMIGARSDAVGREMIEVRCERGADIALLLGMPPATAEAIRHLDEHWDGRGHPSGLRGPAISLLGRILCLAQTFEVFHGAYGVDEAFAVVAKRRARWFDPELVSALGAVRNESAFSRLLASADRALVEAYEPADRIEVADERRVDLVAEAFARVIDAKSPYTYRHSEGVAAFAVAAGDALGMTPAELRELRRAGLLHDIGKLGVSNAILDKPGPLTEDEWAAMRTHPRHTFEILSRISRFRGLATVAAQHHERLDGSGYHLGLRAERLSRPARVLAVADICEALLASRPYRSGLPWDDVVGRLRQQAGTALCPDCVEGVTGLGLERLSVVGSANLPAAR